jgi:hypothetical protein
MHSKRIELGVSVCALFLVVLSAGAGLTPAPTPRATPLPTPTPPPVTIDPRPSATFTFADATQVATRSTTGRFRLVGLNQNETVEVALLSPRGSLGRSAGPLSLDGGKIISVSTSQVATGVLTLIHFQAGNQPGLYRVLVAGLGASARLQFWVADPNNPNPGMKGMVLNPNH